VPTSLTTCCHDEELVAVPCRLPLGAELDDPAVLRIGALLDHLPTMSARPPFGMSIS